MERNNSDQDANEWRLNWNNVKTQWKCSFQRKNKMDKSLAKLTQRQEEINKIRADINEM